MPQVKRVVHLVGILDDIGDLGWGVNLFGRVSPHGSERLVTGDDKRETLAVDDVPMEDALLL